ncbi:two-component system response regulator [Terasakiella brassicae]|uniref:Two-component system response regulator n=1 Tax=Terasakiella brassicae TaxID=1634917 RepID=A0A917BXU7_9PROT|nr:ANTAR domain-containing protein [Terasakiella brassicae]GGF62160.1 two-component system response regulator [Terasakiella brassicae]
MDAELKILVIDENETRAAILLEGLCASGLTCVEWLKDTRGLSERIFRLDPDVILIDLEDPNRDVLEQMFQVSREVRRPIAMFVDSSDSQSISQAVDAGVSAYIVDGLKSERVRSIVEMTVSRFNAFSKLHKELAEAKNALQDRKVLERAKGILMTQRGIGEGEAYALLRKTAMNKGQKISDIASSIVTASEILG